MTNFKNHRQEPYFTYLKNGDKTIEGRLAKGKYAQIKPGDTIDVQAVDKRESVRVKVKRTAKYLSFKDMLENEDLGEVLPDINTVEDAVEVYLKFYSREEEVKFGVVAIEVELE